MKRKIKRKWLPFSLLVMLSFCIMLPVQAASPLHSLAGAMTSPTMHSADGAGGGVKFLTELFDVLLNKFLGPLLHVFNEPSAKTADYTGAVTVTPLPEKTEAAATTDQQGLLQGKVIVIDPGHGGSNPGAVANNSRESDNNLAVGLKLRDKLVNAGAHVIMTRDSDRTVAPEGSPLRQELQRRDDLAAENHADIFVSLHSNDNADSNIQGTETFYHSNKSAGLATRVQKAIVNEVGSVNKGISGADFWVLKHASMPGILVEMGYVSNKGEAGRLQEDSYRNSLAQGLYNGIRQYFE